METESQSLIAAAEQDELFKPEELPAGLELLESEEVQRGKFTAERVAKNQQRYREIVKALAEGISVRAICRAFSIHHHTVAKIREREPELIATEKQRMSKLLGQASRMSVEGFIEDLERGVVPPNVKAIATGIFQDKKALLDGEATVRIEHAKIGLPSLEEVQKALVALPVIEIEILSSESQSGAEAAELPDKSGVSTVEGQAQGQLGPIERAVPVPDGSLGPQSSPEGEGGQVDGGRDGASTDSRERNL